MKKLMLIGNVGRNPDIHTDETKQDFVTFSLGISVGSKDNKKTDWVDVSCNGKMAELAKSYVKKGSKLFVEGFPSVNAYNTRDGKPAATLKVYAHNMEFLSSQEPEASEASNG